MGYYDKRNEARRISKLASETVSSEQERKEFEINANNTRELIAILEDTKND